MNRLILTVLIVPLLFVGAIALAQVDNTTEDAPKKSAKATEQPAGDQAQPSAEDVIKNLKSQKAENPLIEPARPKSDKPTAKLQTDQTPSKRKSYQLKREGTFVITRKGRLIRSRGGATGWMFTFDADKDGLEDPPMQVMPCQMLEDMELLSAKSTNPLTFIISGQVFVYHKNNYLLPTLMKLAPRRGNLK